MLPLDRKYAKEIMNSIGAAQAVTDKDRAAIAISYHGLSRTDVDRAECPASDDSFPDEQTKEVFFSAFRAS